MSHPTRQTYDEIERAFDFFNDELFEGRLPHCLITLQRRQDSYGYFSRDRFLHSDGSGSSTHEIAINPSYFAIHPITFTLSVLAREMVSLDQAINGEPGRRRYKNTEWGNLLEAIGLMPTDTGLPGGKRKGENINHYIIEGGKFDLACAKLVDEEFTLSWIDRFPPMLDNALPEDDYPASLPVAHAGASMPDNEGGLDLGLLADGEAGGLGLDQGLAQDAENSDLDGVGDGGEPPASAGPSGTVPLKPDSADRAAKAAPPMKRLDQVKLNTLIEQGFEIQEARKPQSREKYTCPDCKTNAWAKPNVRLRCLNCEKEPEMIGAGIAAPANDSNGPETPEQIPEQVGATA